MLSPPARSGRKRITRGEAEIPSVLAIVVTHDGREWLRDCLVSLAAQTYPLLDVLVVDDASSDSRVEPPLKRVVKRHLRRQALGLPPNGSTARLRRRDQLGVVAHPHRCRPAAVHPRRCRARQGFGRADDGATPGRRHHRDRRAEDRRLGRSRSGSKRSGWRSTGSAIRTRASRRARSISASTTRRARSST